MTPDEPFNVIILNVDDFIARNAVGQTTNLAIHAPSSNTYDSRGLFSEEIFGPLGSTERMITFGYIKLNTKILQPPIYRNVIKLASLYEEIMAGTAYAIFDEEVHDFVRCAEPQKHNDAGTGYSFFLNRFHDIQFKRNNSITRSERIDIIDRYRNIVFCDKLLVIPAGLRDLEEEQGTLTTDDINKLYQTLLSYSFAISPTATSSIFDGVRFSIQRKAVEIYSYIENIVVGKRGFIQGTWGHRRIALGTRNVITAASYDTLTPDHPQAIQPDETKIGLFQTMKALQPIVVHYVRSVFFSQVFGQNTNMVALTDPDTYQLAYRELSNQELSRFDSTAAIENWISRFRNIDVRYNPITVTDIEGKQYYPLMIYDRGDDIFLFRSITDFRNVMGKDIYLHDVRPLTWAEMFYMATYNAAADKHMFVTRYPVIQDESCYPTKIHLCSTIPARVVNLRNALDDSVIMTYPEYPIIGRAFLDSVQVATARLQGLGGDYDGDTISATAILSDEANQEVHRFLGSIQSVANTQKQLLIGARDDLIAYSLLALSRE